MNPRAFFIEHPAHDFETIERAVRFWMFCLGCYAAAFAITVLGFSILGGWLLIGSGPVYFLVMAVLLLGGLGAWASGCLLAVLGAGGGGFRRAARKLLVLLVAVSQFPVAAWCILGLSQSPLAGDAVLGRWVVAGGVPAQLVGTALAGFWLLDGSTGWRRAVGRLCPLPALVVSCWLALLVMKPFAPLSGVPGGGRTAITLSVGVILCVALQLQVVLWAGDAVPSRNRTHLPGRQPPPPPPPPR